MTSGTTERPSRPVGRAGARVALMERSGAGQSTPIGLIHAQAAAPVRTLSVFAGAIPGAGSVRA